MHGDDSALIGSSKSFLQATGMIPILSASKATVLIAGETGTGKELFAPPSTIRVKDGESRLFRSIVLRFLII